MANEEFLKRFEEIAHSVYPKYAEIDSQDGDPAKIKVNWYLRDDPKYANDDPERQNKKSKTIIVLFDRSFIEDYRDGTSKTKENMEKSAKSKMAAHFVNFMPNHEAPANQAPPIEEVVIKHV
jgi:hypothetical protein